MAKPYFNSIHVVDQDIIIPITTHQDYEPPTSKAPVSAKGPDNEDIFVTLAKKYCSNDPGIDQLIAEKNHGKMLSKIADALDVHVKNFQAATKEYCGESSSVTPKNVTQFPGKRRSYAR